MFYLQCCDCRVLCIVHIIGVESALNMPQNACYFKPLGVLELLIFVQSLVLLLDGNLPSAYS